jgi:glycosyltransferase involved in cell wall biosynthesis
VGNRLPEIAENVPRMSRAAIDFRPLAVEGKHDLGGLKRFRMLLKKERPDVVHFHMGNTFESLPPLFMALFMGFPVIVTEHYLPFPLGRMRRLPLLAKRLAAKKIRKVILLGEVFISPYRRLVKINAEKIAIIPPFSEVMNGSDRYGNRRVIGFAGSFSTAKGVDSLILFAPRLLDLDYRIVFCGRGELEREIDRLAERYPDKIEKRFYAGGMAPFYKDIGILLFLSRSEGLPLAVVEAISAGVPVISTRVGVLEEYFKEGEGIFYLPAIGSDLIVSALQKLADEELREHTVRLGKEIFKSRLAPEKIIMQIEALYQELGMI